MFFRPVVGRGLLPTSAVAILAVVIGSAARQPLRANQSLQPEGWNGSMRLHEAEDVNPDPHVVEVNVETRVADVEIGPGQHVSAWTYDGGLPGPLIRAHVGDRVVVHFCNKLPQPSTIHWHGI